VATLDLRPSPSTIDRWANAAPLPAWNLACRSTADEEASTVNSLGGAKDEPNRDELGDELDEDDELDEEDELDDMTSFSLGRSGEPVLIRCCYTRSCFFPSFFVFFFFLARANKIFARISFLCFFDHKIISR
jgi:hypothetical protein